jgi:hypothetical protein
MASGSTRSRPGKSRARQVSRELSTADLTPDQAVKKLDTLYANPKYSELDLGQALQLFAARAPEQGADDDAMTAVMTAPAQSAAPQPARRSTK